MYTTSDSLNIDAHGGLNYSYEWESASFQHGSISWPEARWGHAAVVIPFSKSLGGARMLVFGGVGTNELLNDLQW